MRLAHKLRAPADKVDLVPGLHSTLLGEVNFADADYVTILDKDSIEIYDGINNQNHHLRKGSARWVLHRRMFVAHSHETNCPKYQHR